MTYNKQHKKIGLVMWQSLRRKMLQKRLPSLVTRIGIATEMNARVLGIYEMDRNLETAVWLIHLIGPKKFIKFERLLSQPACTS